MTDNRPLQGRAHGRPTGEPHRFRELLHRLLFQANRGFSRQRFLRQACGILSEFSGCAAVEIRLEEKGSIFRCRAATTEDRSTHFDCRRLPAEPAVPADAQVGGGSSEAILQMVLSRRLAAAAPFSTRSGSFWSGDTAVPVLLREPNGRTDASRGVVVGGPYPSIAVIPIPVDDDTRGVLYLAGNRPDYFVREDVQFYETVADTLGVTLAHQAAQWALQTKVKELTCLYGIAELAQRTGAELKPMLRQIVELLLPAWQYPDVTYARITLDGEAVATDGFEDGACRLSSEIVVDGKQRGEVEVVYAADMPEMDEGPFLNEERHLIDKVARQLSLIVERKEAKADPF
jgi:GAF domain-containing protein